MDYEKEKLYRFNVRCIINFSNRRLMAVILNNQVFKA